MKTVLLYLPSEDEREYAEALNGVEKLEYDIDSAALLPIGTKIHLTDIATRKSVVFRVVRHHYYPDTHKLCLQVAMKDEPAALTPEEFFNYMLAKWQYGK